MKGLIQYKNKLFSLYRWYRDTHFSPIIQSQLFDASIRLRRFKGRYQGKRCFLMGNGPSLNKMDLSVFRNEWVWGSNRCYLLFDKINWVPKFYTAVDTRVVPDIAIEIEKITDEMQSTIFFFPWKYFSDGLIHEKSNIFWFNEVKMNERLGPAGVFSDNCSKWVSSVKTVTVTMLQLAVYFGFNPIYLIGCDTAYTVPPTVLIDADGVGLTSTLDDDPNHFSSDYFGKGRKWNPPNPARMIRHYMYAKQVCDRLGVQIFNATVGGNLEVFPRVNYLDIINEHVD